MNDEGNGKLTKLEKYQQRIHHLEQIRDRTESCHSGLNRAIENARRQQAGGRKNMAFLSPRKKSLCR